MKIIVTGSQVYGPYKDDSDLDLVVSIKDVNELKSFITKHHIPKYRPEVPSNYDYDNDNGFYFKMGSLTINIIAADNTFDFDEWRCRTERMKTFPPIKNKQKRITVFIGGDYVK